LIDIPIRIRGIIDGIIAIIAGKNGEDGGGTTDYTVGAMAVHPKLNNCEVI